MSSAYQERDDVSCQLDNAIMMACDVVCMVEDSDCSDTEVSGEALVALLYTKFCAHLDHDYFMRMVKIAQEERKLG